MRWFLCFVPLGWQEFLVTPLWFSWKVLWSPDGFLSTAWEKTLSSFLQRPQPSAPGSLCDPCSPAESSRKTEVCNQSEQAGKFQPTEILQTGTSLKTARIPHGSCTHAMKKFGPKAWEILRFDLNSEYRVLYLGWVWMLALKAHVAAFPFSSLVTFLHRTRSSLHQRPTG